MFDPYIKAHARHRPHAVAVSSLRGDVTFSKLDADVDRVASAILDAGLAATRLAAVDVANPYAHWLILLALCRLGICSASIGALSARGAVALLDADLLITDRENDTQGCNVLRATPEWVAHALQQGLTPPSASIGDLDALARVTLSSGTSGTPRMVARTWRQLDHYVKVGSLLTSCMTNDLGAAQRVLSLIGVDTIAYYSGLSTWLTGGTVVLLHPNQHFDSDTVSRTRPTLMLAAPIQMEAFVSMLPPDFVPLSNLILITGGSHLSVPLRRTLRLRLTPNVWNFYGSSEAGMVARGHVGRFCDDHAASGWLEPEVQVEIVDEHRELLPPGDVGDIRVKTSTMVSSYLGDEVATEEHFRDGWFYSGDKGSVSTDGFLSVVGRSDEVVNIGGVKFLPRVLEDAALNCRGVRDAAAFILPSSVGVPTPWLAIVRDEGLDESELEQALRGLRLPPVHLGWVVEVPRNERGKVQTDRLIAAAQARHQTRPKA